MAGSSIRLDPTASKRPAVGEVEPVRVFESAEAAMAFLAGGRPLVGGKRRRSGPIRDTEGVSESSWVIFG